MVSVRSVLCGALTAVAVTAAPAHALGDPAARPGTVEFYPVTSRPGAEVQLRVSGCASARATAVSDAFVTDARLAKDVTGYVADATVRSTMTTGSYPVRVDCDGRHGAVEGQLTVLDDGRDGRNGQDADHHDGLPIAPVHAGGGGSAPDAAAAAPGVPGLIVGGTGVLIAGGLIWYRRRNNAAKR